jgi:hypothetical protein
MHDSMRDATPNPMRNWIRDSTHKMLPRVLWAIAVYAALTMCALVAVNLYAKLVRPFYRWELAWIAPDYEVRQFDIDRARGELAFDVLATNNEVLFLTDRFIPPHVQTFRIHFLVMRGLAHVILLLFVPLAWPGLGWKQRTLALAWAIPILCLVEFVDLPLVMAGAFDTMKSKLVPTPDSLAMIWDQIEETGGYIALGLAGGVLACQMPAFFEKARPRRLHRRESRKHFESRARAKA